MLVPATLEAAILQLLTSQQKATDPAAAAQAIASGIAQAVHAYVSGAQVIIPVGAVAVATPAGPGANAAPVLGTLQ